MFFVHSLRLPMTDHFPFRVCTACFNAGLRLMALFPTAQYIQSILNVSQTVRQRGYLSSHLLLSHLYVREIKHKSTHQRLFLSISQQRIDTVRQEALSGFPLWLNLQTAASLVSLLPFRCECIYWRPVELQYIPRMTLQPGLDPPNSLAAVKRRMRAFGKTLVK